MRDVDIREITVTSVYTIRDSMRVIGSGSMGFVLVVDEKSNRFVRMLFDGDVRRALLEGHGLETKLESIGAIKPVVALEGSNYDDVRHLFDDKIRAIPVLDEKNRVVDVFVREQRVRLPVASPLFDDEEIRLVTDCVVSGWVSSGGPFVHEFEEKVASFCSVKHAISCSSCTSGLHLALLSLGIGKGDEVIIPSLTFIATANAITYTGATPKFVDSEINTWNIDVSKIEEVITKKTKAIIVVHVYGHPSDMDPINDLAKRFGIKVIEDAAEAQGAFYKDKPIGSLGDAAVFSFFGNKIITTGEGGMVVTNDDKIAEKCRIFRDHGMSLNRRYWHEVVGYNYRMTNLQAAVGVAQMNKIDRIIRQKSVISNWYNHYFGNMIGITLPPSAPWAKPICWLYTILVDPRFVKVPNLIDILRRKDVDTRPVFPPVHTQPIYANSLILPVSESISSTGISLPSSLDLTKEDTKRISSIIIDCIRAA